MAVIFDIQPTTSELLTAYKPILIACKATTNEGNKPSFVLCDVYINSLYYRTFFCSKENSINQYIFDIQDAVQEKFNYFISPLDGKKIQINNSSLVDVFVKIRTAKLNESGLNISEQVAPVPGNDDDKPLSGQGTASNKFFVLNALIQNEENQNITELLKNFRNGSWNEEALPLTRRNSINLIQHGQSSYFPILTEKEIKKVKLFAKFEGDTDFREYEKGIDWSEDVEEITNPPSVDIKWQNPITNVEDNDTHSVDLRYSTFAPINIKLYPEDPDGDIESVELFQKINDDDFVSLGSISDSSIYEITDLPIGSYQFIANVKDSRNNTAASNILKYIVSDSTPTPGTITLEQDEFVTVTGGTYNSRIIGHPPMDGEDPVNFRTTYSINLGTVIKEFYEAKGMIASELRIKFKDLIGYTIWRYNNTLITTSNYTYTEVQPSQLNQFNAQSSWEEVGSPIVIHEFEIYHISDPSQKFTNYLQMEFE